MVQRHQTSRRVGCRKFRTCVDDNSLTQNILLRVAAFTDWLCSFSLLLATWKHPGSIMASFYSSWPRLMLSAWPHMNEWSKICGSHFCSLACVKWVQLDASLPDYIDWLHGSNRHFYERDHFSCQNRTIAEDSEKGEKTVYRVWYNMSYDLNREWKHISGGHLVLKCKGLRYFRCHNGLISFPLKRMSDINVQVVFFPQFNQTSRWTVHSFASRSLMYRVCSGELWHWFPGTGRGNLA